MHREVKNFPKDAKQPSDAAGIRTRAAGSEQLGFPFHLGSTYSPECWSLTFILS